MIYVILPPVDVLSVVKLDYVETTVTNVSLLIPIDHIYLDTKMKAALIRV